MTLVPESLDNLVNTTEAADACGVGKSTVSMWVSRGYLKPAGLDPRNRPLYRLLDVLRVARDTRTRAGFGKGRLA
jgi:DNA-binding transcriptional MerR regulator